jgi:PASTA domain
MRFQTWITGVAGRLGHRRGASFGENRVRRERHIERLWDGWEGFLGSVGARWERLTYRFRARRGRVVEALWDGWEGFLGSVGARWERLTYRFRARRERVHANRAQRSRRSMTSRSSIIVGAGLCFVVMVTMAVLIRARIGPPAPPSAASVKTSVASGNIAVPDVRGLSASDARAELERVGLKFAEPRAALGIPGQVLWTDPNIGRSVPPGTSVTVVIGVEDERLGSAGSRSWLERICKLFGWPQPESCRRRGPV